MTTAPDPAPQPDSEPVDPAPTRVATDDPTPTATPLAPPPVPPAREPFWRLSGRDALAIGALALVGLLVAGFMVVSAVQRSFDAAMGGYPVENAEYVVERTTLGSEVTLSGTVQPTQRLDLSFTSEGDVTAVNVNVGDTVTAGSVLATIDDAELRQAVTDARAEVNAAWTDYQNARRSGSSAEVTALRSEHAVKEQALTEAEKALEQASLVSTIDGVVAAVDVHVGDSVGAGSTTSAADATGAATSGGAAVVVISHTFQVDATVGGSERSRLSIGMPATVTVSSSPDPIPGTVTGLGVVAEASQTEGRPGAANFPVTVTLDGQPADVFAGIAAIVTLSTDASEAVLAVPMSAIIDWGSGTDGTVIVLRDGEEIPTPVTLGETGGDMVEIVSGLEEGDTVLITVGMMTTDGAVGPDGMPLDGSAAAPAPEATP